MLKNLVILVSLLSAFAAHGEQNNAEPENTRHPVIASSNNEIQTDKITFSKSWIRKPTPTSVNTAAYFEIHNGMNIDIKMVEATVESGLCKKTEIHGTKLDDKGVMKMYKLESITIPAGQTIEFKPHGNHVMLMGLEKHPEAGTHYSISFKMQPASGNAVVIPDMVVKFPVE